MLTTPLRPNPDSTEDIAVSSADRTLAVKTAAMRRRRVSYTLAGAFALSVLLGAAGYHAAWWIALSVAAVAVAYRVVLGLVRRQAALREWDQLQRSDTPGWDGFYGGLVDQTASAAAPVEAHRSLGPAALARFAVGYLAAWLLIPVVAVAEQIAGGARADSRRRAWLEHLQRMQRYGRQQSVNALKVSMVATAGVGSFAALGMSTGTASAAPIATSASASTHYTVAVGDSLSSIAHRFGTSVSALAAVNGIADPNLIYVGQELQIRGAEPAPVAIADATPAPSTSTYTVHAGDTLAAIAARFGTSVSALASANRIADPNVILVGQVLALHGSVSHEAPATSAATSYTVQVGDTLANIAARFGTTVSALASANRIDDPNLIFVGQVLEVGGSSRTTTTEAATTSTRSTPTTTSTPTAGTSGTSAPSSAAAIAVKVALAQVGKPYVWGGAGPDGFDCSGLVAYAYAAAGISLPHYTVSQYDETTPISQAQLEPGDLVFYYTDDGAAQPGHVTMYVGNGQVVSANQPGTNVQTQSLAYDGTIMGLRRVVN